MALLKIGAAQGESKNEEKTSDYLTWLGFVNKIPLLRSIINANADSVTASWQTYGDHAEQMAKILDNFEGTGKETFKQIIHKLFRQAKTGGNAYAEVVTNDDGEVLNLIPLPPQNVKVIFQKGIIKKYEETEDGERFQPEEIFHLAYNPWGAQHWGTGVVEPMQNLLIDLLQVQDDMAKIYHRYIKPIHVVEFDSDDSTQIDAFKTEWAKLKNIPEADIIVPKGLVSVTRASIPQFSTLDPAQWHRILVDQILMSSRVSENLLGIGTQNSEESARMQMAGFNQMVRMDQKWLEENLRRQLFVQAFPESTPKIKFSFASEPQDERFKREMDAFNTVGASQLSPELKGLLMIKALQNAGLIEEGIKIGTA